MAQNTKWPLKLALIFKIGLKHGQRDRRYTMSVIQAHCTLWFASWGGIAMLAEATLAHPYVRMLAISSWPQQSSEERERYGSHKNHLLVLVKACKLNAVRYLELQLAGTIHWQQCHQHERLAPYRTSKRSCGELSNYLSLKWPNWIVAHYQRD